MNEEYTLFSTETSELKNVCNNMNPTINYDEFNSYYIKIEQIMVKSYESEDNDIEDLCHMLLELTNLIKKMWTNKNTCMMFIELMELKLKLKKLIDTKYREGYDFFYADMINKGVKKSKINHNEEKPRNYINVHKCDDQYNYFLTNIWKLSVKNTEEVYKSIK